MVYLKAQFYLLDIAEFELNVKKKKKEKNKCHNRFSSTFTVIKLLQLSKPMVLVFSFKLTEQFRLKVINHLQMTTPR